MKNIDYALGLDLGIASVGWSVVALDSENAPTHIVDTGVIIVESLEDDKGNLENVHRRNYRGARRTLRRKKERVRRVKGLIKEQFSFDNIEYDNVNVYELKVKGLNELLTEQELAQVLTHYVKHRGFKSNRKNESDSDDGKVLTAIEENTTRLGDQYISELLLKELDGVNKIKNSDDYKYSFLRSQYLEEIEALLDKQIELSLINENFKGKYIEIWSSQRDFSEGPGGNSKYKVDFANLFGYCKFEKREYRAPKTSPSQELNTALSKLINLRFRFEDSESASYNQSILNYDFIEELYNDIIDNDINKDEDIDKFIEKYEIQFNTGLKKFKSDIVKYKLESEQIYTDFERIVDKYNLVSVNGINKLQEIVSKIQLKETVKYSDIAKLINKEKVIRFKGLRTTKTEYAKVMNMEISDSEKNKELVNVMNNRAFTKFVGTNTLKNGLKTQKGLFEQLLKEDINYLDDMAQCFTFYKTDERIFNYFFPTGDIDAVVTKLDYSKYPQINKEVIANIKSSKFKEAASLSLKVLHKINNEMLRKGITYDVAMLSHYNGHSSIKRNDELSLKLRPIIEILNEQFTNEISNPRVIRVLSKTGQLINSCIEAYGSPKYINIEVARDITRKRGKRLTIENEQLENLNKNQSIRAKIVRDFGTEYDRISNYDIEKMKLYEEQNGICMYSLNKIDYKKLYTDAYEIDHIIPYSKSKMNTLQNKTLVCKSENQNKGDSVPYKYIKDNKPELLENYIKQVKKLRNVSDMKIEFYLTKNLNDLPAEFTEGSIEDSRFITKYLKQILDNNLIFKDRKEDDTDIRVRSYKAGYVNSYKKMLGVTNLTHSLESSKYKRDTKLNFKNLIIKNNEITLECETEKTKKPFSGSVKVLTEAQLKNDKVLEVKKIIHNDIKYLNANEQYINLIKFEDINLDNVISDIKQSINRKNVNGLEDEITKEIDTEIENKIFKSLLNVFTQLKAEIFKEVIRKNRKNHLHHALDASVIAVMSGKVQNKIAKYEKEKQNFLDRLSKEPQQLVTTAEILYIKSFEEFYEKEYEFLKKQKTIVEPFENFKEEIIAFIYERDPEVQKQKINDDKIRNLRPLIPVQTKKRRYSYSKGKIKVKGLHLETVYGKRGEFTTERKSVQNLTLKNVDKIIGKNTHSKHIYEACKKWLENKKQSTYPQLDNGRLIKKVLIEKGDISKAHNIGRGYVASDKTVRIDIFENKNDDKLYFLQQNALSVVKHHEGKTIDDKLWYGRDNNNVIVDTNELDRYYTKYISLHPGDLIKIAKKDNTNGLAYVIGFSSGMLQVADIIGDGIDLNENINIGINNKQKQIACSTIKSIEKININIRGEVDYEF